MNETTQPRLTQQIAIILNKGWGLQPVSFTPLSSGADAKAEKFAIFTTGRSFILKRMRSFSAKGAAAAASFLCCQAGLSAVAAPLPTLGGELSLLGYQAHWLLYPFIAGKNAIETRLSDRQWHELGQILKALHEVNLPSHLTARLTQEAFSSTGCETALETVPNAPMKGDAISKSFVDCLRNHEPLLGRMANRLDTLHGIIAACPPPFVPCHADIHAGNLLIGTEGELHIVDWDSLTLAPKECDLMFIGAGVCNTWNTKRESELFYQAYPKADVDERIVEYYRLKRIFQDIHELAEVVLNETCEREQRARYLGYMQEQFLPGNVVAMAMADI